LSGGNPDKGKLKDKNDLSIIVDALDSKLKNNRIDKKQLKNELKNI
jgi:hypothetical protein